MVHIAQRKYINKTALKYTVSQNTECEAISLKRSVLLTFSCYSFFYHLFNSKGRHVIAVLLR